MSHAVYKLITLMFNYTYNIIPTLSFKNLDKEVFNFWVKPTYLIQYICIYPQNVGINMISLQV